MSREKMLYAFAADTKYEKEIATFDDQNKLTMSKLHARKACFCPYTTNFHGRFVCTKSKMQKLPPTQVFLR
jgi:hypothetical protein